MLTQVASATRTAQAKTGEHDELGLEPCPVQIISSAEELLMDADEREIYNFLKPYRKESLSAREICRRAAGKHRYREDQSWAIPPLLRMVERGILESDASGAFRIKSKPNPAEKLQRWISPEIKSALRNSDKNFDHVIDVTDDELDAYHEGL